jgi:FtsP/CotA-like multicopper oxidase with cupredoxin domain
MCGVLDNKVVSETDKILIKKGENVRITIYNNSMMRHPMHLHGHDFRLIKRTRRKCTTKKCCGHYANGNRYFGI